MEKDVKLREFCLQMALDIIGGFPNAKTPKPDIDDVAIDIARKLEKYILEG